MVSLVNVRVDRNYKLRMALNVVLISMNVKMDNIIVAGCHVVISVPMDHLIVCKGTLGGMRIIQNAFSGLFFILITYDKYVLSHIYITCVISQIA